MKKFKRKNFQIIGIALILIAVLFPYVIPRTLQVATITATSGSASDIQAAVNQVVASSGGGDVHIPEGTFNFVEVGEPWMTVNIPAGVNLFGAPTNKDANNQVVMWKTVLVMPWEVPGDQSNMPAWFNYIIDPTSSYNTFRFSDIKLVGYRAINQYSTTMYMGVKVSNPTFQDYPTAGITDFRIDHCSFQDLGGVAVWIFSGYTDTHSRRVLSGVIDHNVLNNTYGDPGFMRSSEATLGYGIGMRRWASDVWEEDASDVWGKYNNYTVVIEDNYFTKWRHATSSNDGIHQIVRHNIFEGGYGIGEVDGHGSYATDSRPYAVGTRAMEVYENIFRNPDRTWMDNPWAINVRGGSAIIFNNTLQDYYGLLDLNNDWGNYEPYRPDNFINQTYIWNNDLGGGTLIHYNSGCVENVNYFLRAPSQAQDGFTYTPYVYPHPLISGEEPPATDGTGTLNVEVSYNNQSITANVEVSTFNGQTPYSQELPVGVYTVTVTSEYGSNTQSVEILSGQTTSINIKWSSTSEPPIVDIETTKQPMYSLLIQIPMLFIGVFVIWRGRKK